MEFYGFYDVCLNIFVVKFRFFCIKFVLDFCNGEKGDDYYRVCSYLLAVIVKKLLQHYVIF